MRGIELAERFYEECGRPMLEKDFPSLLPLLACGLFGSGSECFGFDDEVSRDHDFEPGFCIFLPGEEIVDRRTAFLLEKAYARLPKEFAGFQRALLQPVGGPRHGVFRTADFFRDRTGSPDGILTVEQWLRLPEQTLAEAVNGRIFFDGYGEVTRIRENLAVFPPDIRRKKLAGNLLLMAQSGQYNYRRCLQHGETGAAQLAVHEFTKHAMAVIFLLNDVYQPYYKWSFRALRQLPLLALEAELLEYLITADNDQNAEEKISVIEGIAADIIAELTARGLSRADGSDLEKHAYSVNDGIEDADVRNLHILAAIGEHL